MIDGCLQTSATSRRLLPPDVCCLQTSAGLSFSANRHTKNNIGYPSKGCERTKNYSSTTQRCYSLVVVALRAHTHNTHEPPTRCSLGECCCCWGSGGGGRREPPATCLVGSSVCLLLSSVCQAFSTTGKTIQTGRSLMTNTGKKPSRCKGLRRVQPESS